MSLATDQNEVIAFLSRAESFATTEPVVRIDTHAAIVFLARDKAFKMKRAVTYPYLDFSTLERRKAVCEAEFHLNCRTAPDLYLGVMSVNRQDDGTLGFGPGEAVDWLVVMRRFASEDLLLSVAQRGELQRQTVRQLADHIARFHDTAEIGTCPDGAQRVRRIIEGNRDSMAALDDGALSGTDCMRLHQASLAALSGVADVLDRRAAEGHVRHCHGDLHLANICLWQGQPVLFDCLEFSEDLATIDVLYDLSFLLMDLWERGYRSAANLAFNRYLDMRDEADGLAAIPLFLSMRAAVRAHVGATAAGLLPDSESRAKKAGRSAGIPGCGAWFPGKAIATAHCSRGIERKRKIDAVWQLVRAYRRGAGCTLAADRCAAQAAGRGRAGSGASARGLFQRAKPGSL